MRDPGKLPARLVVDTGILLLPLTREKGWRIARELLRLGEEGSIKLQTGLFNIAEMISVMHRMGYDRSLVLEYASLVYEKLETINNIEYSTWMGVLKAEAVEKKYNIPWGDISSAASALTTESPVVVLDNDPHFKYLAKIAKDLERNIEVLRISSLRPF